MDPLQTVAVDPNADFDARWNAWKVKGLAQERAAKRNLIIAGTLAGALAAVVAIAYNLM